MGTQSSCPDGSRSMPSGLFGHLVRRGWLNGPRRCPGPGRPPSPSPGGGARLVPGDAGAQVSSAGRGTPLSPPPAEVLGASWRSGVVLAVERVTALAPPAAVASWPVKFAWGVYGKGPGQHGIEHEDGPPGDRGSGHWVQRTVVAAR
jgi:hypothetical protein